MFIKRTFFFILFTLFFHFSQAAPLPIDQAFQLQVKKQDTTAIDLHWKMAKGYYLYKDRLHVTPSNDAVFTLGQIQFPVALTKTDKLGKLQSIYKDQLSLIIPLLGKTPGEAHLEVQFQGCSEEGFCYPPQKRFLQIQIGVNLDLLTVSETAPPASAPADDPIAALFAQHYMPLLLLSFYGFGLLLAFTPCVLPMIPVLSGIILSQGESISSKQAFLLSLSYVLGLSFTYAIIGVCFALLGNNLQLLFQSIWMHGFLAFLFIVLALSMFDFYELRPPAHWQNWFNQLSKRKKGGAYWSSALMGSLSTLVLSPCVTPPLVGTLAFIASTGHLALGGLALFFLGLGSGTPLLLISTSAAHYLPKTGHWMYAIKAFFGLLLLALAVHLLSDFLSPILIMALWGGLMLCTGIFIGALTPAYSSIEKAKQSVGFIFFLLGVLIFIGASMGNTNPLQPLSTFNLKEASASETSTTNVVTTPQALQEALAQYKGQAILLDFYADWCTECKYLEATTFREPALQAAFKQIKVIKVDVTKNNPSSHELMQAYQVIAPPTFIFVDAQGKEIKSLRINGSGPASLFIKHIQALE
jgi:thiol:disulfide interchange protein DsbD